MILQQSDETYIYLWRKLLNSEIWEMPPVYLRVWLWILMRVNYVTGRIDRSMNNIGQECAYKAQGGCPRIVKAKQVSEVLEWLESKNMIVWEKAGSGNARYSIITVINWESYQDPHQINSNKEETEEKQTVNEPVTKTAIYNNKSNKLNKEKDTTTKFVDKMASMWQELCDENPNYGMFNKWCKAYGEEVVLEVMHRQSISKTKEDFKDAKHLIAHIATVLVAKNKEMEEIKIKEQPTPADSPEWEPDPNDPYSFRRKQ